MVAVIFFFIVFFFFNLLVFYEDFRSEVEFFELLIFRLKFGYYLLFEK